MLPACLRRGTKIVTNQGWINPEGAAQRIVHWLRHFGARGIKVAAISGALITDRVLELTDTKGRTLAASVRPPWVTWRLLSS